MRVGSWRDFLKKAAFEGEVLRLMGMTALVKPIGLATQMLVAALFGAGIRYDAYSLTIVLATFLDLSLGRVFTAVAVPYMIKLKGDLSSRQLAGFQNAVYLLFLLPAAIYTLLLVVRPELLIDLIGRDMPVETRDYALKMARVMAPPGLLLLAIAMLQSTLNLNHSFRVPAAMPLVNASVFLLVLALAHRPLGIWALPAAFVAAAVSQLTAILLYAFRRGYVAWVKPWLPPGTLRRLWDLSWVALVATTFQTVTAFVDRMFASGLEPGSISSIAYSHTILNFGVQLFSFSLVTIMFTRMSELAAGDQGGRFAGYLEDNLRRICRLVVPVSLALMLASGELVRVLFQRGAFSADDAARTSAVLAIYLAGLPAQIINAVVTRVFHSMQKLRDKMWLSLQYLVTNIAGNALLVDRFGVQGLAFSATISINLHLLLSLWVLRRYREGVVDRRALTIIGRSYAIAALAALAYFGSGYAGLLDGWSLGATRSGAMLVGALRAIFVLAISALLMMLWRARGSRSSPRPAGPAEAERSEEQDGGPGSRA